MNAIENEGATAGTAAPTPKAKKAKAKSKAVKSKAKGKKAGFKNVGTGPGVLKKYAPVYAKKMPEGVKTSGGNKAVDCSDDVAKKLRGATLKDAYEFAAKACEVSVGTLKAKYGKLNIGMQRMNLGNRVRGILNAK